ncbi:hypothetical protein [Candidatus Laterigemmans baculatus]|uniref:hypothetical protein n=1 Tax=Candidatus Laterigemmans baculatus TaxID=2770505 RepID=UPI0013DCBB11|nr:hypothetical protein [Candidatus Laterigemmans baculatus]
MNWNGQSPNTRDERLREIERQLQSVRPTPPSLDEAAWSRIIAASQTPLATPSETVMQPQPQRQRWLGLAAGTIAAIWLSGVVVGSSVMFFVMDREPEIAAKDDRQPRVTMAPEAVERKADAPELIVSETVVPKSTEAEKGTLRQTPDPLNKGWSSGPVLGMQTPLRPFGHEWMEAPLSVVSLTDSTSPPSRSRVRLEQSESQRQLASTFVPPPKATPQRILEDLISDGITIGQPL